jgi:hypothetical protein
MSCWTNGLMTGNLRNSGNELIAVVKLVRQHDSSNCSAMALGFDAQALTGSAEHFAVELLDPIDAFRKRSFDEMSEST